MENDKTYPGPTADPTHRSAAAPVWDPYGPPRAPAPAPGPARQYEPEPYVEPAGRYAPAHDPVVEPVAEPDRPKVEFTDAHRVWSTRAALARNVLVLDLGPKEPPGPVELATPAEIEEAKAAKRAHDEWHASNKDPVPVEMHLIDANHAVAADPMRYVIVPPGLRAPVTLEERVALIERRLGPETQEEIEHRAKRDEEIAARAAERNKVPA